MREAGLAVELLETRHVRDAFKAMPVKSDRNDARGIAQLMRLGWFRPVHCKSMAAQETRAVLTARKLVQSKLPRRREQPARDFARLWAEGRQDHAERSFAGRIEELVAGTSEPADDRAGAAGGARRAAARVQWLREARAGDGALDMPQARLLMSTPAVGPIVALTYACAIDDPGTVQIVEGRQDRISG